MLRILTIIVVLAVVFVAASPAAAQVLQLEEMAAEEIRALDRNTTVLIVPGGILEQHGPHLPSFTDGYINPDWSGYLGAPRHATAALGEVELETIVRGWVGVALRILDGADERTMSRYADMMLSIPPIQAMREDVAEYDSTVAAQQEAWLRAHEE